MIYQVPDKKYFYIGLEPDNISVKSVDCQTDKTAWLTASKAIRHTEIPEAFFDKFRNKIYIIGDVHYFLTTAGNFNGWDMFLLIPILGDYDPKKAMLFSAGAVKNILSSYKL